jgi:hypothetical protein
MDNGTRGVVNPLERGKEDYEIYVHNQMNFWEASRFSSLEVKFVNDLLETLSNQSDRILEPHQSFKLLDYGTGIGSFPIIAGTKGIDSIGIEKTKKFAKEPKINLITPKLSEQ